MKSEEMEIVENTGEVQLEKPELKNWFNGSYTVY